ncbi:MAG: hypothetical protein ACK5HP_01080 [Bacilli bacterium]
MKTEFLVAKKTISSNREIAILYSLSLSIGGRIGCYLTTGVSLYILSLILCTFIATYGLMNFRNSIINKDYKKIIKSINIDEVEEELYTKISEKLNLVKELDSKNIIGYFLSKKITDNTTKISELEIEIANFNNEMYELLTVPKENEISNVLNESITQNIASSADIKSLTLTNNSAKIK